MKMNETVKGRMRPLACIWLAVILLICMCAVPVSAETEEWRTFVYVGDEAPAGDVKLTAQNAVQVTLEGDVPFNEQEAIMDATDTPEGYTLRGWNLWGTYESGGVLMIDRDEPAMTVAADYSFPSILTEMGSGVIVLEPVFEKYWIEKQLTATDPSVEVNVPADAETYQWYTFDMTSKDYTVIDPYLEANPDTEVNAETAYGGLYAAGSGWSTGSGYLSVEIAVGTNDIVTVTMPDDFSGDVYDDDTGRDLDTADNKTYTYTAKKDGIFDLGIDNDDGSIDYHNITITLTDTIYTPKKADGQTDKVYTGDGNVPVACEITMKDDTVLTSDMVELGDYWFTKQPTADDLSVEVNEPADVTGYQWYTYEKNIITKTLVEEVEDGEKEFSVLTDEDDEPMVFGTYADGYWSGMEVSYVSADEEAEFIFQAAIAAAYGDTVKVKFDGEFSGLVVDLRYINLFTRQADGSYALTLTEENYPYLDEGFVFAIVGIGKNFKAEITLSSPVVTVEKVDGQTAKAFTAETTGTYFCRATFDDVSIDSNLADVAVPGEFKDVTPETNFGGAKFDNTLAELEAAVPLTEDEKAAYEVGADVAVALNVMKADSISDADKALIEAVVDGKIVGMHLDITVTKKVGDADAVKLTKLNEAVTVKLTVPAELLKDGRTYTVVRVHDGKAEVLESAFDADTNTLTFETDRFSTYALVYKDTANDGGNGDTGSNGEQNKPTGGASDSNGEQSKPLGGTQTGDSFHVVPWLILILLAGAAIVITVICGKKTKREQ